MSDRKREVVAEYSTYYVCDVHGWDYTDVDDDVCPVCMGESLERERIVKLLLDTKVLVSSDAHDKRIIALIEGENK
jgi:hypothetical protein